MALDLGDLDDFFDGSMKVTIRGKEYSIPAISAELGLWGRKMAAEAFGEGDYASILAAAPVPDGLTAHESMLSPAVCAQMVADGVTDPELNFLMETVFARMVGGDALAKAMFEAGGNPKAVPANRQERRAVKKTAKKAASVSLTTNTVKAATTRTPASGSGTTSRPIKGVKKAASAGRKS